MTSKELNKLLCVAIAIVSISLAWDLLVLMKDGTQNGLLENYVTFEKANIEYSKKEVIEQIKTSIDFRNTDRRNKLSYLSGFESQPVEVLKDLILKMHPYTNTLDSVSYFGDDITRYRQLMNKAQNQYIKSLYKELLTLKMLERLADDVYEDTSFKISKWTIMRPISKDSSYIGSLFYPDGQYKYAYRLNGEYYEGSFTPNVFTIPKTDTLNIVTLYMSNQGTFIDTQYNTQLIAFDGKRWRNQ